MAITYKVLGQQNPTANTETSLYTVPASTAAVISTVTICNQSTAATFRLYVRVAGAAAATKQYLYYDAPLAANATLTATLGITLATTDVVSCYASTGSCSFNLFGQEST